MRGYFSIRVALMTGFSLLLVTCAKEYSYEGGAGSSAASGTATYSFPGTGGNCLGSSVNGKYYTATAPDTSNYVNLQVDVTKTGTYNISTNTVNGFNFNATGSFTQTGMQWVKLMAAGSPASEDTVSFKTPVGQGCSFTVVVEKAPPILAGYSFVSSGGKCTGPNVQGNYVPSGTLNNTHAVDIKVDVQKAGQFSITTDTLNNIYFSAAGTFAATGVQTITLIGHGTPGIADSLFFTPSASGITGCSFPMAVLNGDPMATYVLESGYDGVCIGIPAGTYAAGQTLTTANNININIYISAPGNYTVASQTVNGFRFYGTGSFAAAGSQKLTLQAIGLPVSAGNFVFIPKIIGPHPLGGQACNFTVTVQ